MHDFPLKNSRKKNLLFALSDFLALSKSVGGQSDICCTVLDILFDEITTYEYIALIVGVETH